ncbi:unnamed protein product, partial [Heterosigma akashiwo]
EPQSSSKETLLDLPDVLDGGHSRFEVELEFVQCLSSPEYLHYLAQNKYFEDPAFINFLHYLQYWRRPEYAKFIIYPHCLAFMEMLEDEAFRKELAKPGFKEFVHQQQFFHWQHYINNRYKDMGLEGDMSSSSSKATGEHNRAEGGK